MLPPSQVPVKSFSALAVLSLALGIGANTAIYSFMDSLLLRALPVADGVAHGEVRPSAEHEMDALWPPRVVIVEERLRLLDASRCEQTRRYRDSEQPHSGDFGETGRRRLP